MILLILVFCLTNGTKHIQVLYHMQRSSYIAIDDHTVT